MNWILLYVTLTAYGLEFEKAWEPPVTFLQCVELIGIHNEGHATSTHYAICLSEDQVSRWL